MTGFGMYGSFRAQQEISDAVSASRASARSEAKAQSTQRGIAALEDRLDKLLLVNMAVWELLKERTNLTEDDLLEKVHEIDMRDGVADGKITQQVMKCHKCGRTMSPKHRKCLYCGAQELQNEAYDAAR